MTSESGLHIYAINGRRYGVRTAVHVLTFDGSQYTVKIDLAHHAIDGEADPQFNVPDHS